MAENLLTAGGVAVVLFVPIALLYLAPLNQPDNELPFVMALGCMLIVGWLFGRAADFFLGLPPLLGYMAFGFVFTNTQGPNLQAARSYLLKLAFIVVLVRAGLEISPRDLTKLTVALSVLPFAADALVTGFIASSIYGLSGLEAATYSSIMCSVGEGIIIPRMVDMIRKSSPGHTLLPRAVLTAAPVECILSLFMFGACSSMLSGLPKEGADTSGYAPLSGGQQAGLLLLQITVTLSMATALAHSFALLLGARKRIVWRSGKRFFIGSAHEELIVVIAMAMISYGVSYVCPVPDFLLPRRTAGGQGARLLAEAAAKSGGGHFASLVEADLCVVSTIFIFARLRPIHTVHRVEEGVAGIWTVAAIFLFVSLGSNLSLPRQSALLPSNPLALLAPVAAGLCARGVVLTAIMAATTHARGVGLSARNLLLESAFMVCATLPRATIQGVLGSLPRQNGLVSEPLGELFAASATVTVLLFAPVGVILQSVCCERALSRTDVPPPLPEGAASRPGGLHGAPHPERSKVAAAMGRLVAKASSLTFVPNYMTTADADMLPDGRQHAQHMVHVAATGSGGAGGVGLHDVEVGVGGQAPHGAHHRAMRGLPSQSEERVLMDGPVLGAALAGAHGGAAACGAAGCCSHDAAEGVRARCSSRASNLNRQATRSGELPRQGAHGNGSAPALPGCTGKSGVSSMARGATAGAVHGGARDSAAADAEGRDEAPIPEEDAERNSGEQPYEEGDSLVRGSTSRRSLAGRNHSGPPDPLTAEEDAELQRIGSLYTHAPSVIPLSRSHSRGTHEL